jgi:predicted phage-related endonuclease
MWTNTEYPFAHASLDGWLIDQANDNRFGVLEIKTATINSAAQSDKWKDKIPINYYCQLLHYMAVTDASFAILSAQLKTEIEGEEVEARIRRYRLERTDEINEQIAYLMAKEREFANYIAEDKEPPLILNI